MTSLTNTELLIVSFVVQSIRTIFEEGMDLTDAKCSPIVTESDELSLTTSKTSLYGLISPLKSSDNNEKENDLSSPLTLSPYDGCMNSTDENKEMIRRPQITIRNVSIHPKLFTLQNYHSTIFSRFSKSIKG